MLFKEKKPKSINKSKTDGIIYIENLGKETGATEEMQVSLTEYKKKKK